MQINIDVDDASGMAVDRDGTLNNCGRQGFDLTFMCGVTIHFEDEADAERLARAILRRQGVLFE